MAELSGPLAFVMRGAREAMATGIPHIEEQINSIESAIASNPGLTFDLAKTLVESVCKTILKIRGASFTANDDLPKLFKKVTDILPFLPPTASTDSEARSSLKKTIGGLHTSIHGICELRNKFGFSSHGSEASRSEMEQTQALLVAQSADTIIGFIYGIHRQIRLTPLSKQLEFNDNEGFNQMVDDNNEPVTIFDLVYRPSEVLFKVDREAYRDFLSDYGSEPPSNPLKSDPPINGEVTND